MKKTLLCLLLTGCAAVPAADRWHKAGVSSAQVNKDDQECSYEAEKATYSSGGGFTQGVEDGLRKLKLKEMCMEVRGYRQ